MAPGVAVVATAVAGVAAAPRCRPFANSEGCSEAEDAVVDKAVGNVEGANHRAEVRRHHVAVGEAPAAHGENGQHGLLPCPEAPDGADQPLSAEAVIAVSRMSLLKRSGQTF